MLKPKIDFYILQEANFQQALLYSCRLMEKIVEEKKRVYVQTSTKEAAEQLDALLWTYKDISFLPHSLYSPSNINIALQIGYGEQKLDHVEVLLNLAADSSSLYQNAQHVIEIVFSDPSVQQLARERYRFYREKQCEINTHKLTVKEYDNYRKNL